MDRNKTDGGKKIYRVDEKNNSLISQRKDNSIIFAFKDKKGKKFGFYYVNVCFLTVSIYVFRTLSKSFFVLQQSSQRTFCFSTSPVVIILFS